MQEFQKLYTDYNRVIFRYLLKMTDYNADLAEELTQETFYQVYLSLPSYQGRAGIVTWICSIAKHVCCRYFRKNKRLAEFYKVRQESEEPLSQEPSAQERIEQKELVAETVNEIMRLKKKYRDVLIYRLIFEMTFREIAEIMNIQENSAKVLFHRGKEMVRSRMEEQDREG